jgi:phosphatidylserine/phosphatidylglycerophosphate/cardiolipin synthase-like enzyme
MRTSALAASLALILAGALDAGAQKPVPPAPPTAPDAEHTPPARRATQVPDRALKAFAASLRADSDYLTALYQGMRAADGGHWDSVAYRLSRDNALDTNWLAQTPNVWGLPADSVKNGAGAFMVDDVRNLIAGAQRFVDITSLSPFPTGRFEDGVRQELLAFAQSGRQVTVRILVGWYPGLASGRVDQSVYLRSIIGPLKGVGAGRLTIYVGTQQQSKFSWNHSKMVAVDGGRVILGGENLWDADYLQIAPVHDLNVALRGSVAYGMDRFADKIWASVCAYKLKSWKAVYWKSGMSDIATACLANSGLTDPVGPGTIGVLGAGRLASLGPNGNAADVGMVMALRSSSSTIRISQQDLGNTGLWWEAGMVPIASALVARQNVYIVLSNDLARAGPDGVYYTTGTSLTTTALRIAQEVSAQPGAPFGKALVDLLCSNLHLTTLRFGPSDKWPNAYAFANHAKFFMIDDRVFYIGSENLYPSDLVEYGVFVSDSAAVRQVREQYWDKLWQYSSRVAISGSEARKCFWR